MSEKKGKRRKRHKDDDGAFARKSLVDYSKVSDRHVDDARYEKHRGAAETTVASAPPTAAAAAAASSKGQMSSQMEAVYRLMTGKEERTIAEKLADSNRPTWEQYKKDNEDKLDIMGLDQKKMEAYRKELDEQREKILARGINHGGGKSKKDKKKIKHHHHHYSDESDSDSDDDSSRKRRHKKKHKKKKDRRKKKHRKHHHSDTDGTNSDSYSDDDSRRKRHKKKKRKHKKSEKEDSEGNGDDRYRLSKFFTAGSDED